VAEHGYPGGYDQVRRYVARWRKRRRRDRVSWAWLSRLWANWRSCLLIVKPETVTRRHR